MNDLNLAANYCLTLKHSSYRSEQSYNRTVQSVSSVGALTVPWSATDARQALPSAMGVAGIPALIITDGGGKVLTANGRQHLTADPSGLVRCSDQRKVNDITVKSPRLEVLPPTLRAVGAGNLKQISEFILATPVDALGLRIISRINHRSK